VRSCRCRVCEVRGGARAGRRAVQRRFHRILHCAGSGWLQGTRRPREQLLLAAAVVMLGQERGDEIDET
jgi:hypothetical protein